jgi:hypothetical protein
MKGLTMNSIKRVFSCLTILAVCLVANLGLKASAGVTIPAKIVMSNKDNSLYLFEGKSLISDTNLKDNGKLANHYSHRSHSSHSSHYSSRY